MSEHWYSADGQPRHFVPKKDGSGNRATTLRDARENGWLYSVSKVIKCASAPQLEKWKMLQACTAVLTSPRREGEGIDAFMERVLFVDKEGEQEAKAAADRGTAIHDAIASALQSKPFDPQWKPYVQAVFPVLETLGRIVWTERVIVGGQYAGRADVGLENEANFLLLDFKSARTMPKEGSWESHLLQTSAYAHGMGNTEDKRILTGNIYLSTVVPGQIAMFVQENWNETYEKGFRPLLEYCCWANNYYPGGQP